MRRCVNRPADAVAVRQHTGADEGAVAPLGYGEGVRVPAEAVEAINLYCSNG